MLKQITLVLLALSLGLTAVAQEAAPAKTVSAPPNAVAAALVKQADALEAAGKHDEAFDAYDKARNSYFEQLDALRKEGKLRDALYDEGKLAEYNAVLEIARQLDARITKLLHPGNADAPPANAAAALMKQAGALEAGGKVHEAADIYMKAGEAYKAAGDNDAAGKAYGKSADLYAKEAAALLKEVDNPTAAPATPAPQTAAPVRPATPPAPVHPDAPAKVVTLPPMAPKAGTISGRVVNEMGKPVPSFTIKYFGYQDGVVINNGAESVNAEVQGSGGAYSIKVPPGAYGASAYVTYEYQGRPYKFTAEPLNPPNQYDYQGKRLSNLNGGIVRDFILRMSTKKAGAQEDTESGYFDAYGGGIILFDTEHLGAGDQAPPPLYATIGAQPYAPDSRLLVTLTPQGPMVDGSTGRVVHINVRLGDNGLWQGSQRGIFPGIYSATATLNTPAGETVPLRLGVQNSRTSPSVAHMEWTPSVTVDFLPYVLGLRGGLQTIKLFPAK